MGIKQNIQNDNDGRFVQRSDKTTVLILLDHLPYLYSYFNINNIL